MAIYNYRCEGCGAVTEVWAKMSDPAPAVCPECGDHRMTKLMNRTSFKLKGGGWYAQGYSAGKANSACETKSSSCSTCPAAG